MPSGAALVFAGATVLNLNEQRKQAKRTERAQKDLQKVDIARQNEEAIRARRRTIKESMVRRSQIENVAGATGQTGSTAAVTSTQQVTGSAAENIGQIQTSLALSGATTQAQTNLARAQQPSTLQQVSGAAQQGAVLFKS